MEIMFVFTFVLPVGSWNAFFGDKKVGPDQSEYAIHRNVLLGTS
jgi:hypothetical protein